MGGLDVSVTEKQKQKGGALEEGKIPLGCVRIIISMC